MGDPRDGRLHPGGITGSRLLSTCLISIAGRAHVAYIPDGRVIDLSKVAWICERCSRRLQVRERMTVEIAESLQALLRSRGVTVEATHLCMVVRRIQKSGCWTVTSAMRGAFAEDGRTRKEFMGLIQQRSGNERNGTRQVELDKYRYTRLRYTIRLKY